MSLISVYLLAKTFVFRNEHFQLVFKLKTTLLKIRAPQARWSILSNNRDFQQSLQHNTVEQPPLKNQRNLIPNHKQNYLDKQQSLQIRIQRKSGVWILRTNRNNGTSHTRLRKLLYTTLDRARWMPDTYIKDNNRKRHSRNKTHTLRNHLQQNPPFHPSTHKRKTTTTNSAAPTTGS